MNIQSRFSDYYDNFGSLITGKASTHFLRETKEASPLETVKTKIELADDISTIKTVNQQIDLCLMAFCGFLFPCSITHCEDVKDVSYSKAGAFYIPKKYGISLLDNDCKEISIHFDHGIINNESVFDILSCSYFIILPNQWDSVSIIKYPYLNEYQFYKAKPAGTAYMEIKRYQDFLNTKESKKHLDIFPWLKYAYG